MKTKHIIDLAIITREPFPIGMAATNRIISYSKVISRDFNVKVFIVKPTENKDCQKNFSPFGTIGNLKYEYTNNEVIWPYNKSKLLKIKVIVVGLFNLILKLNRENPKTIIVYNSDFLLRLLLILLKVIMGFKLIIEENEYPKIINKNKKNSIIKIYNYLYRKCDGMIVMTRELSNYYMSIKTKHTFILPMTVDVTRFKNKVDFNTGFEYFLYVGGGGGFKRDGVFDIVKGFYEFQKKSKKYKLLIIGPVDINSEIFKEINFYIINNKLQDQIIFAGVKISNEIPKYLMNATGIIMAPPENFSSGGFPTKLGEFLMSGIPVITTKVSDIPFYLNKENALLVEPSQPLMITNAMNFIVQNENLAKEIGLKGKYLAETIFNAETYKSNMINFLELEINV